MDYKSIKRLGLDHYNFDLSKSYEVYDFNSTADIVGVALISFISL